MMEMKEKNFIAEIKFCIDQSDIIKAKALVQFFMEINPKAQNRVLYELSKSPDTIAFPILDYLLGIDTGDERIQQKIYDLLLEIAFGNPDIVVQRIRKKDDAHGRIYIRIAADLKLQAAVPALIELLQSGPKPEVAEETIRALGSIGSQDCIAALITFLHAKDSGIKQAGISALSEIATPQAIEALSSAVSGDFDDNRAIVDGLARIQNRQSMEKIEGLLASASADIRSLAIDSLIHIGPKAVPGLIEQLHSTNADLQVHALTILGKIGDQTAIPAVQQLLYSKPENSNVRFGAYEALGRLPSAKTAISLAAGLSDPDEQVRMAAAKAIDKNINNVLTAGLKNMIGEADAEAKQIVATLIDAGADTVFETLVEWGPFPEMAADYLSTQAHPDIRNHYVVMLKAIGRQELADQIIRRQPLDPALDKPVVFAVDDSTMMLKLYQKKLHILGYRPITFQYPAEALTAAKTQKPALLITDLNMPLINGLQLTKELRAKYDAASLPILMITTQSDFIGRGKDKMSRPLNQNLILNAGVDMIMHKPFKDEEFAAAIRSLLK